MGQVVTIGLDTGGQETENTTLQVRGIDCFWRKPDECLGGWL